MRILSSNLVASLAISLLVAACGGGGGGSSSASKPLPAPAPAPVPPGVFDISGTITASGSQASDSDTNDPARAAISNDSFASAQNIPNPITLGGYINQPGTGAEGRSQSSGDINDFYQVQLLAGQSVTMLVADFSAADADLYLYDLQGNILDFSIETGEVETLVIARDGTYLVNAFAFAGATNYILAIGTSNLPAGQSAQHFDILPWQTVVKYQELGAADAHSSNIAELSLRLGLERRGGGRGRSHLMKLRRGLISSLQRNARLGSAGTKHNNIIDTQLRARWETLQAIKTLRNDPGVEYAEPNYAVRTLYEPNDEAYALQWHYPLIGLPEAWDTTTGDSNVIVAVVDTGILAAHPDLAGQLVEGYDFVRDPVSAGDGDGIDANPQDTGSSLDAAANSFHGTHVSGTVAARGDNTIGVAGSAYTARVMPVRALGAGGQGTSYDVEQAIRFAAGLPNDSATLPQQAADIINLSLGGGPFNQASQDLFNEVRAAGILVVAAAGNEASPLPGYPASYAGVLSVSAVDAQRRLAAYSNTGAQIDVAAPGGDNSVDINGDGYPDGVLSTGGSRTATGIRFVYSFLNGTSMAAPHVAGVLALMKSINPDLSPADIDILLERGDLTDDLGVPGRDNLYGHGMINAQRAVLAALQSIGSVPAANPRLVASTNTLNFSGNNVALNLVLRNAGQGELSLVELITTQKWLDITPLEVNEAGLGTYRVSVNRSDLPDGIYAADIIAQSTVNTLNVRALISVGGEATTADVGIIYILLYDTATGEVAGQFVSAGNNGEYGFDFADVPAGQYEVIAGSDADNDLLICDPGEACGTWLTLDQPIQIELEADTNNINFPIEYLVSLPSIAGEALPVPGTTAGQRPSTTGKTVAKTRLPTDDDSSPNPITRR